MIHGFIMMGFIASVSQEAIASTARFKYFSFQ